MVTTPLTIAFIHIMVWFSNLNYNGVCLRIIKAFKVVYITNTVKITRQKKKMLIEFLII